MYRFKDGEEILLPAELVFVWQDGDRSVGIDSGVLLYGVRVGDKTYELHEGEFPVETLCEVAWDLATSERGKP